MAINIFFFGDSISFGQGLSIEQNWVTRIGSELNMADRYGGGKIIVQNPSINGNTTRMALERMPYDIQSHKVDILVVTFGMNDCNYWKTDRGLPRVSPRAFEANMLEIIDRGYNFGAKTVIIHTNHPSPRKDIMAGTTITYQESNHMYNNIIREVARLRNTVEFVDIEEIMMQLVSDRANVVEDFTQTDGVHLSDIGNNIYYNAFLPLIKLSINGMEN